MKLNVLLDGLLEILFPPACPACGALPQLRSPFCAQCELQVEPVPTPQCSRCAEPGEFRGLCPRCQNRPRSFTRAFSPFVHQGPIARAIHHFKYEDHPELARVMAALLVENSTGFLSQAPSLICAIPLHRNRFLERKYDQSQLLAVQLACLTQRRCARLLLRSRATSRQVGLSESERELNVLDAFVSTGELSGDRVLLLDDVMTTGATARAAARALLSAGASEVQVLTLARAF